MTNDDSMRRVNRITTVFGFDKQINYTKSPKNTILFIPAVNITDLEKHENLVLCIDGVGLFKTKPYNKQTHKEVTAGTSTSLRRMARTSVWIRTFPV